MLRSALGVLLAFGVLALGAQACSSDATSATPTPDASVVDTGTPTNQSDAGEAGAPIGEWTWLPVEGSSCANGTPTGIGINHGTSKQLVIYLEGGGACWNLPSCYSQKTAANIEDGFDETKFKARMKGTADSHLDRELAENPFKDASFVYIPYCTGDVHAGDKEQNYPGAPSSTKHFGRRNIAAFLEKIVPEFADPSRVILTGSSAGGFGAAVNYWRFKQAFGATRVDLIDDSGPPFPNDAMAYLGSWNSSWDLPGAMPPDCAECKDTVSKVMPFYAKTFPDARFALLSYDQDAVISQFFNIDGAEFKSTLAKVTTETFDPTTNARVYELSGTTHTMLGELGKTTNGSKKLAAWLTDMVSDAAWTSVKPLEK